MQIQEIKSSIDIIELAGSLGIRIDKRSKKAICPFHDDKNPSLQFSKEKQICTCFSSNCGAGTMDVIGLTEKKLKLSTHEALNYLSEYSGEIKTTISKPNLPQQGIPDSTPDYRDAFEIMQSSFLSSSPARKYVESRNLNWKSLNANYAGVGYNAFKNSKFDYLRGCIIFALRNSIGGIVSMYGRSIRGNDKAKHYYTAGREGVYPHYPNRKTRSLILTESVIDAASLLSHRSLLKDYAVLAQYGTNGYTTTHSVAIGGLENLKEVILFFDGDEPGRKGADRTATLLTLYTVIKPSCKVKIVSTPEGEDINSLLAGHEPKVLLHLIKQAKDFIKKDFLLSHEKAMEAIGKDVKKSANKKLELKSSNEKVSTEKKKQPKLITDNPNNITLECESAIYAIKGGLAKYIGNKNGNESLKVTLYISLKEPKPDQLIRRYRCKTDLYEDRHTEKLADIVAEKLELNAKQIEVDLHQLTDLLDDYINETNLEESEPKEPVVNINPKTIEKCISFLKRPNLIESINDLIGKSGVAGEETARIFLLVIASSYKMADTLHALIQGSSGSGKTHLLSSILNFMPQEDTITLTRITESSLYNYGKYELKNKLIGMEDYDGLEEKAELAFRELQSKGMISSSTSGKNEQTGEIAGYVKIVHGPIASLSATTRAEVYEDNSSRCFLVAVDESRKQTMRIINYQNKKAAGTINEKSEQKIKTFLQNCIRLLKPYKVINPYAAKITLPESAHKIRRLNGLFQSFVRQVTLINQYNRKTDDQGRLITEKQDLKTAIDIMFDSIILKVDELDGSLRQFYEKLKKYVEKRGEDYEFTRLEIRQDFKISKSQQHAYMNSLLELEYIHQSSGFVNRGYKYKINYWDDNSKLRNEIAEYLNNQISSL